jgi:surfactin synthase thioesterase subunit
MTLVRLIFCPDAGGSAGQLQPIPFSPDVEVMTVQYHGRTADISRLANEVEALGERPTVFFGHDRGALLAFETVRRLEETTNGPYALILLTTYPCPPGSRVRSPITVITGDPQTTVDEQWRRHTEGAFQLKVFDDGQFSVTDYVNVVNDEIDRMIRWLTTSRKYLTMF